MNTEFERSIEGLDRCLKLIRKDETCSAFVYESLKTHIVTRACRQFRDKGDEWLEDRVLETWEKLRKNTSYKGGSDRSAYAFIKLTAWTVCRDAMRREMSAPSQRNIDDLPEPVDNQVEAREKRRTRYEAIARALYTLLQDDNAVIRRQALVLKLRVLQGMDCKEIIEQQEYLDLCSDGIRQDKLDELCRQDTRRGKQMVRRFLGIGKKR